MPPVTSRSSQATASQDTSTPLTPRITSNLCHSPMLSPMHLDSHVVEHSIAPLLLSSLLLDKQRGSKRNFDDSSTPTSPTLHATDTRQIAPLKTTRRPSSAGRQSPKLAPVTHDGSSRESSPATETTGSPKVKRARASSISGQISNFHILPSSDDEMDDPLTSPTTRTRMRFNQLLGPSPLQKSFSTAAVDQASRRWTDFSPPHIERAITLPAVPSDGPAKTRAQTLLSKMEKVEAETMGTEMNKVFMMVHGRGLGMGATSGGRQHRRGSALRPRDDEPMDTD